MLPKSYDPKAVEDRIYRMWEESGAFRADAGSDREPFTISMPPPNATGQLHVGHAVMLALEDIFIRFQRMRGKEALWLPGTDHAAIATEAVVIRQVQKEEHIPDPRAALGREELIRRIEHYVAGSQGTIRGQVRKMGASCDWSREKYTMDPALARCTNEVFVKMYNDGVIYRGHRIVNWDPRMQTTVADDEIEYVEERSPFYVFRYGPFEIGTARPETKFGDKYVVMHPDDERYARYAHGDTFDCEWINGRITATVIKDKAADPAIGTGVMTITPWHDHVDFEIAERHKIDKEQIIDSEGKLLPIAGEFAGMPIEDARPQIVEKLKEKGLLVKVDGNYVHNVAVSYRGRGKIEPQIKEQWFVNVNRKVVPWKRKIMSLKEVMQDVVLSGDIRIIPERFEKTYFQWIDNLRDWCISRQIWWGHRIPVWYCIGDDHCTPECKFPIVRVRAPEACPHCGSKNLEQDPDTLDTWYGVAMWTWATLLDPRAAEDFSLDLAGMLERSPDVRKFHPTQVMETGYDILFFWVARMILMTTYAIGQIPFKTVYLHGLIRTRDGAKMSKSHPESMIDPLDIISRYGADALRMSMIVGQSPGNDQKLYEEKIAGYRNFVNKLWNAARFVLMQCEEAKVDPHSLGGGGVNGDGSHLSMADRALLHGLQHLVGEVTQGLEEYRLSEVGERLYSFTWDYFCDWYLELSKGEANPTVLVYALRTLLLLLHPYCPFVTEELWEHVKPKGAAMLMREAWPGVDTGRKDQDAYHALQVVIDVIAAIRSLRAEQGVEPGMKVDVIIHATRDLELLQSQREHIMRLGRVRDWTLDAVPVQHKNAASAFLKEVEVHIPLEGIIDLDKMKAMLSKEGGSLEGFIKGIKAKLGNAKFLENAPSDVVALEREKLENAEEKLAKIEERLKALR